MKKILLLVLHLLAIQSFAQITLDGKTLKSNAPYYLYQNGPTFTIPSLTERRSGDCVGWGETWGHSWHTTQWLDLYKETESKDLDLANYTVTYRWIDDMCQSDDNNLGNGFFENMAFDGFSYTTWKQVETINETKWIINTSHAGTVQMNRNIGTFRIFNDNDKFSNFFIFKYESAFSELSSHTFNVVEPLKLSSNFKFSYCKNDATINVLDFVDNKLLVPGGKVTVKIDGVEKNILDPSILSSTTVHTVEISMTYDNGTFNRSYNFEIKDITPIVINDLDGDNKICKNTGVISATALPNGGTWSLKTGSSAIVTNNNINANAENPVGDYALTYTYTNNSGCVSKETKNFSILDLPNISTALTTASFCSSVEEVDLKLYEEKLKVGTATWSETINNSVVSNKFIPSFGVIGNNKIKLTFVDEFGCYATGLKSIVVNPLPVVDAGSDIEICANANSFTPAFSSPSGGKWSGTGFNSSNTFFPNQMSSNTSIVEYTYKDANGCSDVDYISIKKNPLPIIKHDKIEVCSNVSNVALSGGTPTGGTYTGSNVTGGFFNVSAVQSGSVNTVTYSVNSDKGCSSSLDFNLFKLDNVVVDAGPDIEACLGDVVTLTGNNPKNGIWNEQYILGEGVINTKNLSVGQYNLTYQINSGGCTGVDTRKLTINALPTVNLFASPSNVCLNDSKFALDYGTPQGGTWFGQGVEFTGGSYFFNPKNSLVGSNNLTYTYTNAKGCKNSIDISYFTRDFPKTIINQNLSKCIDAGSFDLTPYVTKETSSNKGVWISTSVNGSTFNTTQAGVGTHKVIHQETNIYNCVGETSMTVNINSLPTVNAGKDTIICENWETHTLAGFYPNNGIWSNNSALSNIDVNINKLTSANTTLTYTYTDQNQCTNSDQLIITKKSKPKVTASLEHKFCENSTPFSFASGLPSGGTYFGNGLISNKFYPAIVGDGISNIYYTFGNEFGCYDTAKIAVTVYKPTYSTAGLDSVICISATDINLANYNFSSPQGVGQRWYMTPTVGILQNVLRPSRLAVGEYVVYKEYTDLHSCVTTDSIIVEIKAGLGLPVVLANNDLCFGDTVSMSTSVQDEDIDTRFFWYEQGKDSIIHVGKIYEFVPQKDITLFVAAENGFGCPSSRKIHEVNIEKPNAKIVFASDSVDFGSLRQIKLENIEDVKTFNWTFAESTTSNLQDPYKYFYKEGVNKVQLELISNLGCKNLIKLDTLTFVRKNAYSELTDAGNKISDISFASTYIQIYPTLVNDVINVDVLNGNISDYDLKLYDSNGREHFIELSDKINVGSLNNGIYILRLRDLNSNEIQSIKINKL